MRSALLGGAPLCSCSSYKPLQVLLKPPTRKRPEKPGRGTRSNRKLWKTSLQCWNLWSDGRHFSLSDRGFLQASNQRKRTVMLQALPWYLRENPSKFLKMCEPTDREDDVIKGMTIGILAVVEDVKEPLPAIYSDVVLIVEKHVVLRKLGDVPNVFRNLMGLLYALNMNYPKDLRYTFEGQSVFFLCPCDGSLMWGESGCTVVTSSTTSWTFDPRCPTPSPSVDTKAHHNKRSACCSPFRGGQASERIGNRQRFLSSVEVCVGRLCVQLTLREVHSAGDLMTTHGPIHLHNGLLHCH
ncbi:hypothetical protein SRHO_G00325970 [Serrasalmus rhombeus]